MMTCVHATYVLVTFVHISNISAVIDPILTKLFGPNILGASIFVNKFFFGTRFFCTKSFFEPNFFNELNLLEQWGPYFLKTFFLTKFLLTQIFLDHFFLPE